MTIRISRAALAGIVTQASLAGSQECCGLLMGAGVEVSIALPTRNVADDPRHRFEIDPAALIAAHRTQRHGGPSILGCYHSHPGGDPAPSPTDACQAEPNGWLWMICGGAPLRATLWQAVAEGSHHGRFSAIPFEIAG